MQLNHLVKTLLDKESLEQCSLQEVEQYASRHPYFGAAQLLLTKKMQLERHALYDEQLQKTYLFFHNPLWVQQLLDETGDATVTPPLRPTNNQIETIPAVTEERMAEEGITSPVTLVEITTPVAAIQATPAQEELPPAEKEPEPKAEIITSSPEPAKEELLFEPFHTVDYFASQGIQYKPEEKPSDKFGQQLRSFTDWLKAMKKLPVAELAKTVESVSEKKVVQLAEQSLSDREVLTESMAEVWVKQGNNAKAIELYHKLSLLEPAKSVYFAAKIEALEKKS